MCLALPEMPQSTVLYVERVPRMARAASNRSLPRLLNLAYPGFRFPRDRVPNRSLRAARRAVKAVRTKKLARPRRKAPIQTSPPSERG